MTPLVEANHNFVHDGISPALLGRHHRAADTRLTRKILISREVLLMRCTVCQSDTPHASFCVSLVRTSTEFSRVGCFNQSTTLRISISNSIDIGFSNGTVSKSGIFFGRAPKTLGSRLEAFPKTVGAVE